MIYYYIGLMWKTQMFLYIIHDFYIKMMKKYSCYGNIIHVVLLRDIIYRQFAQQTVRMIIDKEMDE